MSKDISSDRIVVPKTTRNEGNENEFESELSATHFPPPRTPLNTIPDPSQYHRESQDLDFESKDKLGSSRVNPRIFATPRIYGRGKAQSEPNSAQSTPTRSVYRVSNVGSTSGNFGMPRPPQYSGARGGSVLRVSRGIPLLNSEQSVGIPHYELVEDPYFWRDHNVQVLIRIRPLNNTEMMSQSYGQCLRQESAQTLVWLGHPEARFTFDHIACETISQEKLFRVAGLPMVDNCMSGYNSCMFAYGQTGSGKTYTMMGEIFQMDGKLDEDCGITPRIFEYLFTRISEEEEGRRDERLNYSCKCSFLEIYNEQITDLLEPSSSNLQLREDLKKGVYVENLTEHSVKTVNDVLKLLLQGAANRKIAATYMNSESSRSHSVFTCTIESRWEKDSTTHTRFGRLNLVDLAGSERQKSSGAEGDRLKEAVNINKSLSTLGLVIMSLVDVAHGKHRHVPYRDSRLTFLLQDSLGGNSKTTIIANVSPSICSANETLSTLKFAQRAKLIQNNAKVNEDASGNVSALQRQIQQLQGQLSFLMEHYDVSKPVSNYASNLQQFDLDRSSERNMCDDHNTRMAGNRKMVCLEAILVGALRREKLAETAARRLAAEIEQLNRLAQQREEEAQHAKMILRFREDKIKRLELFVDGVASADKYIKEENNVLKEEIQLLQERIDRNPELTRFALENVRLLNQIRLFQEFYKQGEREKLLAEISELRNQLLESLQGNYGMHKLAYAIEQDNDAIKEVEDCKNMNSKLMREVDELRAALRKYCHQSAADSLVKYPEELKQTDTYSVVETVSTRDGSRDEMASCNQQEGEVLHNNNGKKIGDALIMQSGCPQDELSHARSLIETMESEQICLIKELHLMQEENFIYREILSNKNLIDGKSVLKLENSCKEKSDFENTKEAFVVGNSNDIRSLSSQANLDRMIKELEEARSLNCQYQEDQITQLSWKQQTELVCEQVEMETAKTILHLQEEVAAVQSELEERLCYMAEENTRLRDKVAAKEDEIRAISMEWERATSELTSFLIEGSKSLRDASGQIESIAHSFPHVNVCLSEQVERAAKVCVEKEATILVLNKSLEDARTLLVEMEQKLKALKGATVALTEAQQQGNDASIHEAIQLSMPLNYDVNMVDMLENKLTYKVDSCTEAENVADGVYAGEKRLSDCAEVSLRNNSEQDISMSKTAISSEIGNQQISEMKAHENDLALDYIIGQQEMARVALLQSTDVICKCCSDTEIFISALHSDVHEASCIYRELVQGFVENIQEMRKNFVELKENCRNCRLQTVEIQSSEEKIPEQENQYFLLQQIRDKLSETNDRLNTVRGCIYKLWTIHDSSVRDEDRVELDTWSAVCSTSCSDPSAESVALQKSLYGSSSNCCDDYVREITEQALEVDLGGSSTSSTDGQELQKSLVLIKSSVLDKSTELLLKEFKKANDAFNDANVQFSALLQMTEIGDWSNTAVVNVVRHGEEGDRSILSRNLESRESSPADHDLMDENLFLKKELERKEEVLKGLLFDFSLLQESASTIKDVKGESEKLIVVLSQVQQELQMKTNQLNDVLAQHAKLEDRLADTETALFISDSDLEQAKGTVDILSNQIAELRMLLEDLYLRKSEVEIQLEEQREVVKSLEEEILRTNSSLETKLVSSADAMEDDLMSITIERDHLREQVGSLQDRLEMAYSLVDENEAILVEARQESEACKVYAEQKEEEVKILERSVQELECTVNVLEKKVNEMEEEVEKYKLTRDSLEFELQALEERMVTVENSTESMGYDNSDVEQQPEDQLSRQLHKKSMELHEAVKRIRHLEEERAEQSNEMKQCKEYISELVLHADAQASQYQHKYKTLEDIVRDMKTDDSTLTSAALASEKTEKSSLRQRGSSSPFRCISSLVQQMNVEKDQELSQARFRIEELEALAASRQKEVCMLNTRLAAAESMTHDVIRDLLGVKLDMTNYANLVDQYQLQKLMEDTHVHAQESIAMEQEIHDLQRQINNLVEERERCISEIYRRQNDVLAAEITVEQLQEREQLLAAENEMLKVDICNLKRRIAELDEMVKKLFGTQNVPLQIQQQRKNKENLLKQQGSTSTDLSRQLEKSKKIISRVNEELAQYRGFEMQRRT